MSYLISQMWLCLLITAIIAGIVGWLLRGNGKEKLQMLDQQWREQYHSVDNARRRYANKVEKLSPLKEKNNELALQVSLQKKSFEDRVQDIKEQANVESDKKIALLVQKDEEITACVLQCDKKMEVLKEEKERSKQRFEKMMVDKEQASLSQIKKDNEVQITELEEELLKVKSGLKKEQNQKNELQEGFNKREKTLKEQLNKKEDLLSLAIKDKNDTQKALEDTLEKLKLTEKSFLSEVKDKFDDFNTERKNNDTSGKVSGHENKISSDIKSMFEATGISDLAKTGLNKVRNRFDDMKK